MPNSIPLLPNFRCQREDRSLTNHERRIVHDPQGWSVGCTATRSFDRQFPRPLPQLIAFR